jgi:hypothetical protein
VGLCKTSIRRFESAPRLQSDQLPGSRRVFRFPLITVMSSAIGWNASPESATPLRFPDHCPFQVSSLYRVSIA